MCVDAVSREMICADGLKWHDVTNGGQTAHAFHREDDNLSPTIAAQRSHGNSLLRRRLHISRLVSRMALSSWPVRYDVRMAAIVTALTYHVGTIHQWRRATPRASNSPISR